MGIVSAEEKCEPRTQQQTWGHSVRGDVLSLVKNYALILQAFEAPKRNWRGREA